MAMIPVRFKRITAAFDDVARARLCQSSGSEHSAADNSVTDLSDLVDSFLEGGDVDGESTQSYEDHKDKMKNIEEEGEREYPEPESYSETKEMLMNLIGGDSDEEDASSVKSTIRVEIETACRNLQNCSPVMFKRRVMTLLRQRGFDAGLCKSRWAKTDRHPAGEYEYVDILISSTRYILEISLTTEFTIARPTKTYSSLLQMIPYILILKETDLKQAVRLMCAEMGSSLKKRNMLVSPWRRNGYMQAKWFGSYKRTTNAVPSTSTVAYSIGDMNGKSLVGFEYSSPQASFNSHSHCRREVGAACRELESGFDE